MARSKYAEKKARGLCAYTYNQNSESYQSGAWKNWKGIPTQHRKQIALSETASGRFDRGFHCFVEPYRGLWARTDGNSKLEWAYRYAPSQRRMP